MATTSPAYRSALALYNSRQFAQARDTLQRALQRSPEDPDLNMLMGATLTALDLPDRALVFLERTVARNPANLGARTVLAEAQMRAGDLDAAEKNFTLVAQADANAYPTRINLANLFIRRNQIGRAIQTLRETVALRPDRFDALNNLALFLTEAGQAHAAAELIRHWLASRPQEPLANQCLAKVLNYTEESRPAERLDAHRIHGDVLLKSTSSARAALPAFANDSNPSRPLKVAFVSQDFREHSVTSFLAPLLEHIAPDRIQTFAYSNLPVPDATTRKLQNLFHHWRDIHNSSDEQVAAQSRADAIDLAIDLSGLTTHNRLRAFAIGLAPVQLAWCGYPATTGLTSIHFRIVDEITDPPGAEADCVEQLLRIAGPGSFLCYQPPADAPDPAPPADQSITFASFNMLGKLGPRVYDAWAAILTRTPGARLLLKSRSLDDPFVQADIRSNFSARGVDPARLELLGYVASRAEHLALYRRVTVALDTFPYCGTTTTCEALWMGVPVVTLLGSRHASRVGASLLTAIHEPSLIARSPDDYIQAACSLAADTARLAEYRRTLRPRIASSPLCDAPGFARRFEHALRQAWQAWCSGSLAHTARS